MTGLLTDALVRLFEMTQMQDGTITDRFLCKGLCPRDSGTLSHHQIGYQPTLRESVLPIFGLTGNSYRHTGNTQV